MPSSSSFTVRRLEAADICLLRELNALFGRAFADPATFKDDPPDDTYVEDLLSREHIAVVVALKDEDLVGGLVAYAIDKFEKARREYYIYDLAVDEGHRRQRIATALIRHLCDLAAQHGAWVVYIQADYGDEPAIALYEKLGARKEVLHFDIALDAKRTGAVPR
jgi:aminoglycoside 3-N-acetyltransferase I